MIESIRGRRVYLDAKVFIYFLDGSTALADATSNLLTAAGDGVVAITTGQACVAEVMVGPYRTRDLILIRAAHEFFDQPALLEVVSHTAKAWDEAAMLRGTSGIPLMDALHLATAAATDCDVLVTNDDRMKSALGVEVMPLASFATPS